jgi:hypothetical protein
MPRRWPLSQFHSRRLALLYPGARGYHRLFLYTWQRFCTTCMSLALPYMRVHLGRFTHESGSGFRTPRPKPGPSSHNPAPSRAEVLGPHGSALIKHFANTLEICLEIWKCVHG